MASAVPSMTEQLQAVVAKLMKGFYSSIQQQQWKSLSYLISADSSDIKHHTLASSADKMADRIDTSSSGGGKGGTTAVGGDGASSSSAAVASSAAKRTQPPWTPIVNKEAPQLRLLNSFTRTLTPFRPINGNQVQMYICGPTVYDQAHMGHARAYLSFDIVRRVLAHYFKYDLLYVMNITDIDDKIIKRARQTHLYEAYLRESGGKAFTEVASNVYESLKLLRQRIDQEVDEEKQKMLTEMARRVHDTITKQEKQLEALFGNGAGEKQQQQQQDGRGEVGEKLKSELLAEAKDILSEWLDATRGTTITELPIFSRLARKYENEFLQDMRTLDVLQPDVLTRVSEYIPEIVNYVERIIANGYAYVTQNGSVYFDTAAFEANPKHNYAKLVPEAYGDAESAARNLRESEGELSVGEEKLQEKRSSSDFALWKSSKAGEPYWDSPWGRGRPGWHIECSAMSQAICGQQLDIHAGGFDLKFPHHDNEVAQCEAHMDTAPWVNYFLHCGTLRIAGSKMSKSLKNFISIRQALREYTSRQLRLLFLMHHWSDALDYSTATMERVLQFERFCQEFFLAVKDLHRRHLAASCEEAQLYTKFSPRDLQLLAEFQRLKAAVHEALCNSIDTRETVEKIREMVSAANIYISEMEKSTTAAPNAVLLMNIAGYITTMLQVFGVIPSSSSNAQPIGFPSEENGSAAGGGVDKEELIMPYLTALADFRDSVRKAAKEQKNVNILQECDHLRDKVLPELGVRLEDKPNNTSCVKLVDRQTLLREQEQKEKMAEAKAAEKLRQLKLKEEAELKKRQKAEQKAKQQQQKSGAKQPEEKGSGGGGTEK